MFYDPYLSKVNSVLQSLDNLTDKINYLYNEKDHFILIGNTGKGKKMVKIKKGLIHRKIE